MSAARDLMLQVSGEVERTTVALAEAIQRTKTGDLRCPFPSCRAPVIPGRTASGLAAHLCEHAASSEEIPQVPSAALIPIFRALHKYRITFLSFQHEMEKGDVTMTDGGGGGSGGRDRTPSPMDEVMSDVSPSPLVSPVDTLPCASGPAIVMANLTVAAAAASTAAQGTRARRHSTSSSGDEASEVLQPQDRDLVVIDGEQFAIPKEPVRRGTQLRGQMVKQDKRGNWVCFFRGCGQRMSANFSRHIIRHERQGDQIEPSLAQYANPRLALILQKQMQEFVELHAKQQRQFLLQSQAQSMGAAQRLRLTPPSPPLVMPQTDMSVAWQMSGVPQPQQQPGAPAPSSSVGTTPPQRPLSVPILKPSPVFGANFPSSAIIGSTPRSASAHEQPPPPQPPQPSQQSLLFPMSALQPHSAVSRQAPPMHSTASTASPRPQLAAPLPPFVPFSTRMMLEAAAAQGQPQDRQVPPSLYPLLPNPQFSPPLPSKPEVSPPSQQSQPQKRNPAPNPAVVPVSAIRPPQSLPQPIPQPTGSGQGSSSAGKRSPSRSINTRTAHAASLFLIEKSAAFFP